MKKAAYFIFMLLIIAVIAAVFVPRIARGMSRYTIVFQADRQVEAIEEGYSVSMLGVTIGRVDAVRLHGRAGYIVARIDKKHRIPMGSDAEIASVGFLGEKMVYIRPSRANDFYEPGDTIGLTPPAAGSITEGIRKLGEELVGLTQSFSGESSVEAKLDTIIALLREQRALLRGFQNR